MVIKIYVNEKLEQVGYNEFVAMNNYITYCNLYGKENVRIERTEQDFGEALRERKLSKEKENDNGK